VTTWDSLIGHQRIINALKRAVHDDTPHHAYLFLGPEGIGKGTTARLFARSLVCEAPQVRPCNQCTSCRQAESGTHIDILYEAPEAKGKSIAVAQVREIQRKLSYRQTGSRFRVVVIDEAGALNADAQNKLLKTLEEPPARTVLVLCSLHAGLLLPTVRSRCQKLSFGPVASEELEGWLVARHNAEPHRAARAASAARGLPGRALELLDPDLDEARTQRLKTLLGCVEGNTDDIETLLAIVQRNREESRVSLDLLEEVIRDAVVRSSNAPIRAYHETLTVTRGPLTQLGPGLLSDLINDIETAKGRLKRHVDSGALIEDLLLRLHGGAS
jgi:DNA polymerase-3 subunit delta'